MLEVSKAKVFIAFILLALIIVAAIFAMPQTQVFAENTSVIIDLNSASKFDAFNDVFAYTYGTTLYVVKDNFIYPFKNAFVGDCVSIEINATNILVLAKNGSDTSLYYFTYNENGIKSEKSKLGKPNMSVSYLFSDDAGKFYIYCNKVSTKYLFLIFEENKDFDKFDPAGTIDTPDAALTHYQRYNDTKDAFAIKNSKVYVGHNYTLGIDTWEEITTVQNASDITIAHNEIFVNTSTGIYKLDPSTYAATKIGKDSTGAGEIAFAQIDIQGTQKDFLFVCENNSVVQYLYTGTTCEYYNKFNNSEYVHPTNYDLVYVAKATNTADLYSSPRNMQVTSSLELNEYFLVLCQVNSEESGSYFYIAQQDGTKGYIKSTTSFERINPNSNVQSLKIGLYAQALFPSVSIYKYPYSGAEVLTDVTIYDELIVKDNVAEDNGAQVWNYYKVSYVQDGQILTGYVKITEVSPYTSLKAPSVLSTVKISSGSIGALVYLYALPTEDSAQVAALTDGEELDLAEEYNKDSTWTKVVYKGMYAYVQTSQIAKKGLTAVQITLIVVSCVVVAVSVVLILVLRKKRKIGF